MHEAQKHKDQMLKKIDQGKVRDSELEVELKELECKMNKVKEKRTSLAKAM